MSDIFLSYSRADQATAKRFAVGFERAGFSVWWDQDLNPGEAFDKATEKALEEARAVVVLWSRQSVDSRWVRAEATQANTNGTMVPVMIEACKRPIMFELTHTVDLTHWRGDPNDKTWQACVAGVRRLVQKDMSVGAAQLPPTPVKRVPRPIAIAITLVVAMLAVAAAGLWGLVHKGAQRLAPTSSAVASPTAPVEMMVTLAVLPFADLSAAHDQEYFSDGLTEELLNQLAQVRNLRVTARTSSFAFKGKNEDVRVISEQLGVANLLEGSVRKDGTHLRITTQLISGKDGVHLWSKTYARELSDIFALQEEVSKDVAKALSVTLDVGDLPSVQGGTTNVDAYDKYLQGRKLYLQGGAILCRVAASLLREAVALDPQFSRAWLLLAYSLAETTVGVPPGESEMIRRESAAASQRAMNLSPDAWWALDVRANEFMRQHQWGQAETVIAGIIAPSASYEANGARLGFLGAVGRIRELAQRLEQASQLDPLSFTISADLQVALDAAGQPEKAQVEYERSRGLTGIHQRSYIYAIMRLLARKDASPAAIGKAFQTLLNDEKLLMPLSHALAKSYNSPQQVRADIGKAIEDPGNQDRVRMTVIAMYADGFGERDLALTALERAAMKFGSASMLWLPYSTELRADPRFKELLKEVGLAQFFRASGKWNDFCAPTGAEDFECH